MNAAIEPVGWPSVLELAQELRLGAAVVSRLRDKHAVPPIPAITLPNGTQTVTASLDQIWLNHVARREVLSQRLTELLVAMNAAGLKPLLLKGARSLATGSPDWRTMRDIDLLVPGPGANEAYGIALELGYRPATDSTEKPSQHHLLPLFRDDMPGWIEIHQLAATHRAERLLPTEMLQAMTSEVSIAAASARILTPAAHALHALVHHHVGHRGDKDGLIDLKGLFEFSADLAALSGAEIDELISLARRHPRLLAALDLWVAAADTAFDPPLASPLQIADDARARAAVLDRNADAPRRKFRAMAGEIAFASATSRLRRLPGGDTMLGRGVLRARVVGAMLAR